VKNNPNFHKTFLKKFQKIIKY
jgi:hypothetical protein